MKTFLTTIMAGMMSVCSMAQTTPAAALKTPKNANPLCPYLYTADPTAVEYEGRLYVYGTNDTQQFNANNKTGGNGYGAIRSLVVLSTDDMVNWLEANDKRYDTGGFRCMAVNKASVGENNQKIVPVKANNEGVTQLKKVNPYVIQQAEMTSTGAGLEYENFFNEGSSDSRVSYKNMVIGDFDAGAWTMVRGVDFGSEGATSFTARLKGKGIMEVRLDDIASEAVATVNFSSARLSNNTVDVDKAKLTGVHDVYFYFPEVRIPQFDEWSFSNAITNSISEEKAGNDGNAQYFDMRGRQVKNPRKGEMVIIKNNGYTKIVMR